MYFLALFYPLSCSPTKLSTPLPIPIPFIQPSCPKSCQYKAPPSVHALTGNGFPVLSLLPRLNEPRCHVMLWRHTIYWAFCRHFVFRDHVIVHCLCVQPISVGARATWLSHMTNVIGSKYANSSWRHIILTRNFVPLFLTVLPWQHQGSHSDWKTWKTWKNGKAFSSQGKVREFWTDWKSQGKVRENHTKYWKTQGISDKYYFLFFSDI